MAIVMMPVMMPFPLPLMFAVALQFHFFHFFFMSETHHKTMSFSETQSLGKISMISKPPVIVEKSPDRKWVNEKSQQAEHSLNDLKLCGWRTNNNVSACNNFWNSMWIWNDNLLAELSLWLHRPVLTLVSISVEWCTGHNAPFCNHTSHQTSIHDATQTCDILPDCRLTD